MNIRQRILLYFSLLSITLTGLTFLLIFSIFQNYRAEEYRQRINDHVISTISILAETQALNQGILQSLGELTVNRLFKEKTLIFDAKKRLIYSSIDDTKIEFSNTILNKLNSKILKIASKEGDFDVVGVSFIFNQKRYYGISKAYDIFGFSKLAYLKNILGISFLIFMIIILISTFILSKQITKPLISMALALKSINIETSNNLLPISNQKDEMYFLTLRFNELMKRLQHSFSFQKHAVHHISHELKTPIAVLVNNLERLEIENDIDCLKKGIKDQKEDTMSLGEIINSLLEIAKVETHANLSFEKIRVDEILYDGLAEARHLYPNFKFDVSFADQITNEESLSIVGNFRLIKMALQNLLLNCIHYSNNQKAKVEFRNSHGFLIVNFSNQGDKLDPDEIPFLFQHFFRGKNSIGKRGFGLGLVLVNKIMELHRASIIYQIGAKNEHIFSLKFQL